MKIINITQGSPEWHAFRATHYNASDAPAMMGLSAYETRDDLIVRLATGITQEVDAATQQRFDEGHRLEALGREWLSAHHGEDFYPVVYESGKYGASLDGQTMDGSTNFEHKTLNTALRRALNTGELPEAYLVQVEHQMMVSGAESTFFVAGEEVPDENGELKYKGLHTVVRPLMTRRARIIAGWEQLAKDVGAYKANPPAPQQAKPVGEAPEAAMGLTLQVRGEVVACNVPAFKAHAVAVISSINRVLVTDQDFADAEKSVKWCIDTEAKIKAVKDAAIAQQSTIEEAFRALDDVKELLSRTRLDLKKLVDAEKLARRAEIIRNAGDALSAHIKALGVPHMPNIPADFGGVMKGMKTLESCQSKVNNELASAKIMASAVADCIAANIAHFEQADAPRALFPDFAQIVQKTAEDFKNLVENRVANHHRDTAARAEQARQRAEAEATMQAERAAQAAMEKFVLDSRNTNMPALAKPVIAAEPSKAPRDEVARVMLMVQAYGDILLCGDFDWREKSAHMLESIERNIIALSRG